MERLSALERQANTLTQSVRHHVSKGDLKTARDIKNHINAAAQLASLIAQNIARKTKSPRTAVNAGRKAANVQAHVTRARNYINKKIIPKGRFNIRPYRP
jgi:hypothetical protein